MNATEPKDGTPTPESIVDRAAREHRDGFSIDVSGDDEVDKTLAALEMAGEEVAAGFRPARHAPLAPEVRFLHSSRTIHELITDRNRSVGIFLFVASVLFAASSSLLDAKPVGRLIVPLAAIQYWCLPVTFATLAVIGAFVMLILARTRVGLIYEVSKMNALLGLPSGRVQRISPLSIFFLMQGLVVLLGGASLGTAVGMVVAGRGVGTWADRGVVAGVAGAVAYIAAFESLYFAFVRRANDDARRAGPPPQGST